MTHPSRKGAIRGCPISKALIVMDLSTEAWLRRVAFSILSKFSRPRTESLGDTMGTLPPITHKVRPNVNDRLEQSEKHSNRIAVVLKRLDY